MEEKIVDKNNISVSFIIPAKNEEEMLPDTINGIHNTIDGRLEYEIIVMDNGSTDKTTAVATLAGAKVNYQDYGSIGAIRNVGVQHAHGEFIVFLDADILLADTWYEQFVKTLKLLIKNPNVITGSRYTAPSASSWIADSWFWEAPQSTRQITHVPTGHMITTKHLFEKLKGFDERLETAEDFDFCFRAKKMGAEVLLNPDLVAVHYGMPRTISEFFRREIWHGAGDVTTLKLAVESKVVIASLVFLLAHIGMIIGLVLGSTNSTKFLSSLLIVIAIIVASVWKKYRYAPNLVIIKNIVLFYVYYWGRSIAIINKVFPVIRHRSPRAGRV